MRPNASHDPAIQLMKESADAGAFVIFAPACQYAIDLPYPAASAVTSFYLAMVVNLLLSSRCVFNQAPTMRGFGLFFVAAVGGLMVNVSVTLVGSPYLGIAPVLAKIVGVGTAFLLNFWLKLRIVFRTPSLGMSAHGTQVATLLEVACLLAELRVRRENVGSLSGR